MCGIVGVFHPQGDTRDDYALTTMRDAMVHRGPDGGGLWRSDDRRCALAHRRLAIIDLSDSASQPMANHDGSVVLVFNGEIYNHAEIRTELEKTGKYRWKTGHSDTEVLLHAYEEWGLDCVKRFYGMFAFAVYDARNPNDVKLHLVRDRVGIKPLYFARTQQGEWLFGSEIRALLEHPHLERRMDKTAFWHYLTFIVAPAPLTMFRDVFKLPAGHTMTIHANGRATTKRYWDCLPDKSHMITETDMSEDEAVEELKRLLRQSIKRRMVADVPFGVLLSGGVDSSLNVALMSELMDRPVTTFTVGYKDKENYNEFQFAKRISQMYKTDHHEIMIDRQEVQDFLPLLVRLQDEPIADNVCIPLYFLAKLVKDSGTTVVQVGEGADENFLGYWWCDHYGQKARDVYDPIYNGTHGGNWFSRLFGKKPGGVFASDEDKAIAARATAGQELFWGGAVCWWGQDRAKLTPNADAFDEAPNCPVDGLLSPAVSGRDSHEIVREYMSKLDGRLTADPTVLQKIPYMEHQLRLPEHLLMRVDKLTMAHSIEARVPFLDHDVVEFAARLTPKYKLKDGVGKHILKRLAEQYLPHDIVYRKKQGFGAPIDEWFREGDFGQRCQAAFRRSQIRDSGLLDNDYFEQLLTKQMTQGGEGFRVWTVMNAVLWHESWVENNVACF